MKYFAIIVGILLLITGIADLSVGIWYYQILRWVVCICSGILAYQFYVKQSKLFILYLCIAILFNPVAQIYLGKELWKLADIITALAFIPAVFNQKK